MKEWNEHREPLIDLFGKVRDEWIQNDLSGWISANRYCELSAFWLIYLPIHL